MLQSPTKPEFGVASRAISKSRIANLRRRQGATLIPLKGVRLPVQLPVQLAQMQFLPSQPEWRRPRIELVHAQLSNSTEVWPKYSSGR